MLVTVFWLMALTGLAVLFGWLAWRAWGGSNPIVKWGAAAGSAFLGLVVVLVTVVVLVGFLKVYAPRGNPVIEITVAGTPAQVERGAAQQPVGPAARVRPAGSSYGAPEAGGRHLRGYRRGPGRGAA